MADKSISQLSPGVAVTDTDLLPNVQVVGVGPVKTTAVQIKTYTNTNPTVTGVIKAQLGSAAAPSYTFDGDLNTGWFSPAADTLAAATNGIERLRVTDIGTVGIATVPPVWWVNAPAIQLGASSSLNDYSASGNRQTTLGQNSYLNAAATWTYANTDAASRYHQTQGQHQWFTAPSGTAGTAITFTQPMTLTAAGNLGIGTTSPVSKLHVSGGSAYVTSGDYMLSTAGRKFGWDVSGVFYSWIESDGVAGNNYMRFAVAAAERMRIDATGNIGFNAIPSAASNYTVLDIKGRAVGQSAIMRFYDSAGTQTGAIQSDTNAGFIAAASSTYPLALYTNSLERLTITSAGNVGINATSPGSRLNTISTASGYAAQFNTSVTSSGNTAIQIGGYLSTTGSGVSIRAHYNHGATTASSMAFEVNGATEVMRFDSSGNMIVGSTTALLTAVGRGNITLNGGSSSVLAIGIGGALSGYLYHSGTQMELVNVTANPLTFSTNNLERMRIDSAGNVGIGVTPNSLQSSAGTLSSVGVYYSTTTNMRLLTNTYFATALAGAAAYQGTGAATQYMQNAGSHIWFNAPSGTAGNAITFTQAMTLDASGNLAIGATTAFNKLDVTGNIGVQGGNSIFLNNSSNNAYAQIQNTGTTGLSQLTFYSPNNGVPRLTLDNSGNVVVGNAAIATNATNGFLYVPSCAGTPTGTPTAYAGRVPIVVDTTNNKLYFYSGGAWRDAGP